MSGRSSCAGSILSAHNQRSSIHAVTGLRSNRRGIFPLSFLYPANPDVKVVYIRHSGLPASLNSNQPAISNLSQVALPIFLAGPPLVVNLILFVSCFSAF
jgi:hypothetical protein